MRIWLFGFIAFTAACSPSGNDTDTGTPPDTDGSIDCLEEVFSEVAPDPANSEWADPYLQVTCTDNEVEVVSNGIPGYEFQSITPNGLSEQDYLFRFPLYPELADQTTEIPLLGTAGVAINGLPIFGPNEGPNPDPYGDPVYNGIMDFCMGHTAMGGTYHYHALLVECLTSDTPANQGSPIIGYANDGFPIYGPRGCIDEDCTQVVEFKSSWEQTGDPTTYAWDNHAYVAKQGEQWLDECNGRIGPDGTYRYHATSTFPYLLGCFAGTPTDNGGQDMGGGDNIPMCEDGQSMCCGDGVCDGPETADNCSADC